MKGAEREKNNDIKYAKMKANKNVSYKSKFGDK